MKRSMFCLAAMCLGLAAAVTAGAADIQALITVSDVEKVSGVGGLKIVPRHSIPGAGGDLNFATADGQMFCMVVNPDRAIFEAWKKHEGYFHGPVPGVGDEAYSAPGFGNYRYILSFRKGDRFFSLSSFLDLKAGKPFFTMEQLTALAKTIISRL